MPQSSYGFAVGRVRVLEQGLLRRAGLDRLAAAPDMDAFARTLAELGFGDVKTREDIERATEARVRDACLLIRAISPEPAVTDCFLIRHDMLNLKLLIKSRQLGLPEPRLADCGTLDVELLRRCVAEQHYGALKEPLRGALTAIEQRISVHMDPLALDAALDAAMYDWIRHSLRGAKNPDVARYFRDKADLTNLKIALRAGRMGRGSAFARGLMLPGGALDAAAVAKAADDPALALRLLEALPYGKRVGAALADPDRGEALAALEREADDHLLGIVRERSGELQSVMPLICYLLSREREAAAVRLLAAAKGANARPGALGARLRRLYN